MMVMMRWCNAEIVVACIVVVVMQAALLMEEYNVALLSSIGIVVAYGDVVVAVIEMRNHAEHKVREES